MLFANTFKQESYSFHIDKPHFMTAFTELAVLLSL